MAAVAANINPFLGPISHITGAEHHSTAAAALEWKNHAEAGPMNEHNCQLTADGGH